MTTDGLDALLADIDALEADDEPDDFPWTDAARWSPVIVVLESCAYLEFADDGCVMVCDASHPHPSQRQCRGCHQLRGGRC